MNKKRFRKNNFQIQFDSFSEYCFHVHVIHNVRLKLLSHLSTGCAMSGLIADSRTMVDKARVESQVGWFLCFNVVK